MLHGSRRCPTDDAGSTVAVSRDFRFYLDAELRCLISSFAQFKLGVLECYIQRVQYGMATPTILQVRLYRFLLEDPNMWGYRQPINNGLQEEFRACSQSFRD